MSEIGKEWREVLREYIEQQPPVDNDTYWAERKRLNKEYALNNHYSSGVTNEEQDNDK